MSSIFRGCMVFKLIVSSVCLLCERFHKKGIVKFGFDSETTFTRTVYRFLHCFCQRHR